MALPQFLRIILGTTIFCVLLQQASIANAISPPLQTIQTAVERVVEVLSATENQGEAQRQKRLAEVGTIIRPLFDRQEVAKRTLGFHWKDRTEQQREEFINIFTQLVEISYGETFDKQAQRYLDQAKFEFDKETIDGRFAVVETSIVLTSAKQSFSIDYRFHQVENQWLIYDVVVERVSMIRNFRTQFYRIIAKHSYEELVTRLRQKVAQLTTSVEVTP